MNRTGHRRNRVRALPPPCGERGVALIEALIAITVLAVGVLGTIYFQGFVMSMTTVSQQRLEASMFSEELLGMVLSDPTNAGCYANAGVTTCASANAAAFMTDWTTRAQARLPGSSTHPPAVTFAADRSFTITLQWVQKDGATVRNLIVATQIGS